jgi:hypothetical protein
MSKKNGGYCRGYGPGLRREANPLGSIVRLGGLVEIRGIPHLAKNERDMGHPDLV